MNGVIHAYYRVHSSNMHNMHFGGLLDDFVARRRTYKRFFELDSDRLSHPRRLRHLAQRRLAREALRQIPFLESTMRVDGTQMLMSFAADLAPNDHVVRALYRLTCRRPFSAALLRAEAHRSYLRDRHELQVGT